MIEKRLYQAGERFISRTRWRTTRYTLADAGTMGKYLIGDGDKQTVWRINHTASPLISYEDLRAGVGSYLDRLENLNDT
jgi:hypothetical protein